MSRGQAQRWRPHRAPGTLQAAAARVTRRVHAGLLVVVVRGEEVPVRPVLLAPGVLDDLYVLAELVRQARQVVRAVLEIEDRLRGATAHERLR